jgi:hypothetical protein
MSERASAVTLVQDELQELVAPLRSIVARMDDQIQEAEKELDELKSARRTAFNALRAADPTMPGPGRRKNVGRGHPVQTGGVTVSERQVALVQTFLEDRRGEFTNGGGFTGTDLVGRIPGTNKTAVRRAVRVLHERGVLRLDRAEGTAKFYVLV